MDPRKLAELFELTLGQVEEYQFTGDLAIEVDYRRLLNTAVLRPVASLGEGQSADAQQPSASDVHKAFRSALEPSDNFPLARATPAATNQSARALGSDGRAGAWDTASKYAETGRRPTNQKRQAKKEKWTPQEKADEFVRKETVTYNTCLRLAAVTYVRIPDDYEASWSGM